MADIRVKRDKEGAPIAWLVRWRENGKQRYRQFRDEGKAEEFKKTVEPSPVDKLIADAKRRGEYVDVLGQEDRFGRPKGSRADDERWSVVRYARRMIEAEDLRDATRFAYERALRLYFEGTPLGEADVRRLTPTEIDEWWLGLKAGRAEAQRLISKILRRAVRAGDREDNPLSRTSVRKPRGREEEFDPLTAEQIERLAEAATQATKGFAGRAGEMVRQRDRLMILLMGFAGLRAGEVGGLREQDLLRQDGRCQLRIRQQVVRDRPRESPRVAPLKTPAARRTITIGCSLWEEVRAFIDEYGAANDGRIFHGPNGEARDNVLTRNVVTAAARRAGMRGVHPHLLRHSAVSLLIHGGANPRQIQTFVGHADVAMTLGRYGHLFDTSGVEMAEIMERLRKNR